MFVVLEREGCMCGVVDPPCAKDFHGVVVSHGPISDFLYEHVVCMVTSVALVVALVLPYGIGCGVDTISKECDGGERLGCGNVGVREHE